MTDEDVDELGPVDYLVVEFPASRANFSGEMAAELTALVDRGLVRVLDLLFLKKDADGTVEGFESHEFGDDELGELRALEDELALLVAASDVTRPAVRAIDGFSAISSVRATDGRRALRP